MFKVLLAMLFVIPLTARSAENELKEGKWELKISIKTGGIPNMPALPSQASTRTQCIKKGDGEIKDAPKMVTDQACKVSNIKVSGTKVSWNIECDRDGVVSKGKGSFINKNTSFESTNETDMSMSEGMSMKTSTKIVGK